MQEIHDENIFILFLYSNITIYNAIVFIDVILNSVAINMTALIIQMVLLINIGISFNMFLQHTIIGMKKSY